MPRRKTRYFPSYGRELPNAGPSWRWQRAVELVDSNRYVTQQRDGPHICRAAKVYRAKKRGFGGRGDRKLYTSDPDLIAAEAFENGPMLSVVELKMRVLAGQGVKTVATKLGLTESLVSTYHQFFFDIADVLEAKSWIYRQVIGIEPGNSMSDEQLAMRDAYVNGPERIEPWLDFLVHRFEEHDLSTAIGRQREAIALHVMAANFPVDRETSEMLSRTLPIIEETRSKMFQTRSASDQIARNTDEMLQEVRFRVPTGDPWRVSHDGVREGSNGNSDVGPLTAKMASKQRKIQLYDAVQQI